jgi:hypothetical protein
MFYPEIDLGGADFGQLDQAVAITRPHFEIDAGPGVDNRYAAATDILQDDFGGFGLFPFG